MRLERDCSELRAMTRRTSDRRNIAGVVGKDGGCPDDDCWIDRCR